MGDCLICLGTELVLVPTFDDVDVAPCPDCCPQFVTKNMVLVTVQHPSGKVVIQTKEKKS